MKKKTVVLLVVILAFCTLVVGVLGFIFFRFRAAKKQRSEQPPRPVEKVFILENAEVYDRWLYEYDQHGNLTKETYITKSSCRITHYENEYDEYGLLIKQCGFYYLEQEPYLITSYSYDYFGNLIKVEERMPEKRWYYAITTYRYDLAGNLIFEKYRTRDVLQHYKRIYKYGENNKLLTQTEYDYNGKLSTLYKYIYDVNGLNVESICFFPATVTGELLSYKTEYTYDGDGRCILETSFHSDGDVFSWTEYRYE